MIINNNIIAGSIVKRRGESDMFQNCSTILYVHFRNSKEGGGEVNLRGWEIPVLPYPPPSTP
jgi:hypothetical protein